MYNLSGLNVNSFKFKDTLALLWCCVAKYYAKFYVNNFDFKYICIEQLFIMLQFFSKMRIMYQLISYKNV